MVEMIESVRENQPVWLDSLKEEITKLEVSIQLRLSIFQ
jgi:hypothetical protein